MLTGLDMSPSSIVAAWLTMKGLSSILHDVMSMCLSRFPPCRERQVNRRASSQAGAILAVILLGFLAQPVYAAEGKVKPKGLPKLVVAEIKTQTTIEPKLLRIMEEQMANEVGKTGRYSVIGRDDINRMLDSLQTKQMMGCSEIACYVEIGGAMGADLMIAGTMDRVGSTVMISVKLINITSAEVLARESETIRRPSPEEMVNAATALVERMFSPRRPNRQWMWVTACAGGASLVTGAIVLGVGAGKVLNAQGLVTDSTSRRVTYTEFDDLNSTGKTMEIVGGVLLGVGVGLGVASVVLYYVDKSAPASTVAIGPAVGDGFYGLSVGGGF